MTVIVWNRNRNKFINQIRASGGHIQLTIMIDTQQRYIKLNILSEVSIIVVQAHWFIFLWKNCIYSKKWCIWISYFVQDFCKKIDSKTLYSLNFCESDNSKSEIDKCLLSISSWKWHICRSTNNHISRCLVTPVQ